MRQLLKKILAFNLGIAIMICCMGAGYAASTTSTTDYQSLFEEATSSDGAYADMIADKLGSAFNDDPIAFIKALSTKTDGQIESVAGLVVYSLYFDGFEAFKEKVNNLKDSNCSDDDLKVIDAIQNYIDKLDNHPTSDEHVEPIEAAAFNPEVIHGIIELNLSIGTVDEEFFNILGQSYRKDPVLFAETISEFSTEEINYIAKAVAYDCINTGSTDIDSNTDSSSRKDESFALTIIQRELEDKRNGNIDVFFSQADDEIRSSLEAGVKSTIVPTIGTMTYTSGALEVGTAETLRVTFSESTGTSAARTYWTEVYGVRNGTPWLKASKYVTIPAGSTSTNSNYSLSFSDVGVVYTLVKVYSSYGGTLLASRQGIYSDTVYGDWSVLVSLPTNRDYKGTLTLYEANGSSVVSGECLGRSIYNYDMYTYEGNTPTGTYTGYLAPPEDDTGAYGAYKVINMTGVSGAIIQSGRDGIWIHGGRIGYSSPSDPWYPLYPTLGCVRVGASLQLSLQNNITTLTSSSGYHYTTGNITITES